MDGLRTLARQQFATQKYTPAQPARPFDVYSITSGAAGQLETVAEAELADWAAARVRAGRAAAGLTASVAVVCVHRELDVSLCVSREAFAAVLAAMRAHEAALYMVSRDYDGFHSFGVDEEEGEEGAEAGAPGAAGASGGSLPTWFLGTSLYALLWTFDLASSHTFAVFFNRRRAAFPVFTSVLGTFVGGADGHGHGPHAVPFAVCVHQLRAFDEDSNDFSLGMIRRVERYTGYKPHADAYHDPRQQEEQEDEQGGGKRGGEEARKKKQAKQEKRRTEKEKAAGAVTFDIDRVTEWSKMMGVVAGDAASKLRHQGVCRKVLADIKSKVAKQTKQTTQTGAETPDASSSTSPPTTAADPRKALREASNRSLSKAVPVIESQMDTYAEYVGYLKFRAERLSDVLFVLLTHEDAVASIRLADAARRDSLSMKTIAIMTMAFLPGAFISSLFAVPTLNWDADKVIGSRFWVYWAFTLPATIIVFVGWIIWSEWDWKMPAWTYVNLGGRKKEEEKKGTEDVTQEKVINHSMAKDSATSWRLSRLRTSWTLPGPR